VALDDGDFLGWYNEEVNRYRDHEWQLTSYSIAFSSAVVLFAKGADTSRMLAPWAGATAILALVIALLVAEVHSHLQLNRFRLRRTLLVEGGDHRATVKAQLSAGVLDGLTLPVSRSFRWFSAWRQHLHCSPSS
jgi:hypothetical protein